MKPETEAQPMKQRPDQFLRFRVLGANASHDLATLTF